MPCPEDARGIDECDNWFETDGMGLLDYDPANPISGIFHDPETYTDPWHWLPMTRWTDVNDFFYTNEGGIRGFVTAAINAGFQTLVSWLFSLASFMWSLTVWFIRIMVGAPTLAAEFLEIMSSSYHKYSRAVVESGLMILVFAVAFLMIAWGVAKTGTGRGAFRRIMQTVLPFAIMLALLEFSTTTTIRTSLHKDTGVVTHEQHNGTVFETLQDDGISGSIRNSCGYGGTTCRIQDGDYERKYVGTTVRGPEWLFANTLKMASLLADPLVRLSDEIHTNPHNAPDQISTCDSYMAVLEGNFIRSWRNETGEHFEQASKRAGGAALQGWANSSNQLRMRLALLISRIWERSYVAGYGQAQFGDPIAAERAFCLIADWRSRDVTVLEQLAIWRTTCQLQTVQAFELRDFMPLIGCDLMPPLEEPQPQSDTHNLSDPENDAPPVDRYEIENEQMQCSWNFLSSQGIGAQGRFLAPAFLEAVEPHDTPHAGWADSQQFGNYFSYMYQAWTGTDNPGNEHVAEYGLNRESLVQYAMCNHLGVTDNTGVNTVMQGYVKEWVDAIYVSNQNFFSAFDPDALGIASSRLPGINFGKDTTLNFMHFLWTRVEVILQEQLAATEDESETLAPIIDPGTPITSYAGLNDAMGYATAVFSPGDKISNNDGDRFRLRTFFGTWAMCDFTSWYPASDGITATSSRTNVNSGSLGTDFYDYTSGASPLYSPNGFLFNDITLPSYINLPLRYGTAKVDQRGLGIGGDIAGADGEQRISAKPCIAYMFGNNGLESPDREKEDHQAGKLLTLGTDRHHDLGADIPNIEGDGFWFVGGGEVEYPHSDGFSIHDNAYPGAGSQYVLDRLGRTPEEYRDAATYVPFEVDADPAHATSAPYVQNNASAQSAADVFEAIHGRSRVSSFLLAIMAVFVAWAYLWSLSGLALGSALSVIILAMVIATLPLTLLISALPFQSVRGLPKRLFKLGIGAALSYGVFTAVVTMILLVIDLLMDVVKTASVDSSELLYTFILGIIPLIAIKAVSAVSKKVTGVDISRMKGAFQLTSGMAFAAMAPPVKDGRQYLNRASRHLHTAGAALGGAALGGNMGARNIRWTYLV